MQLRQAMRSISGELLLQQLAAAGVVINSGTAALLSIREEGEPTELTLPVLPQHEAEPAPHTLPPALLVLICCGATLGALLLAATALRWRRRRRRGDLRPGLSRAARRSRKRGAASARRKGAPACAM